MSRRPSFGTIRVATNAIENEADIAYVQQWLGHANIATTDATFVDEPDQWTRRHLKSDTNFDQPVERAFFAKLVNPKSARLLPPAVQQTCRWCSQMGSD